MVEMNANKNLEQSPKDSPGSSPEQHGPSEAPAHSHSTSGNADAPEGVGLDLDGSESDDDHVDIHAIPGMCEGLRVHFVAAAHYRAVLSSACSAFRLYSNDMTLFV